jgi:hypothetical protein
MPVESLPNLKGSLFSHLNVTEYDACGMGNRGPGFQAECGIQPQGQQGQQGRRGSGG